MPIHEFGALVEDTAENIDESDDINDRNKELIREYLRDKRLDGLSDATLAKNLSRMKQVAEQVDRPLDEMDKADMKDLVEWLQSRDYTDSTVDTYKSVIKAFWMWLDGDGDDHPEPVAWITSNGGGNGNDTLPKDLLTKDDIKAQVDAAYNNRDKALIWLLYESGARIGELIDLTVGDIEDRKNGKKVVIEGKTGARRIPLVESVSHLNRWLNNHPNPEKDAPLWCKIQQGQAEDQLGYRYIRDKILKKTMEKAEIDKPSNPHHYRHSRASHLAATANFKQPQLCEWFGWVQGSDDPAKYIHLSGRDLDNAYDAMHGLADPEEDEDEPDVIECWRCEELEDPGRRFCGRCGAPLDKKAADAADSVREDIGAERVLAELEQSGELPPEQVEEIAADDALMAQLIKTRAEQSG